MPAGQWTVKAWHEQAGETAQRVTVASGDVPLDLTLDASGYKPSTHKNKFGKDYSRDEY